MAHNIEPMDIDNDFDNKENTFHHSNVLPCTEKGYEELDVSELNMKLRYSITPASSPMSKSYTANCLDNRNLESTDDSLNILDNKNLTRSFNSMMSKPDNMPKSFKVQPLQLHSADQPLDNNRNTSVLRPLDTTLTSEGNKIIITTTEANDSDDSSFPSSPSSILHSPEAKVEIPRNDGGSPIMRGLKSVLNMFRSSQSPIPVAECDGNAAKHDISVPEDMNSPKSCGQMPQTALASTPKSKDRSPSKRNSPHKESVVFNDDLEKELLWKDETTILFSQEKIPIHKLFFQQSKSLPSQTKELERNINKDLNKSLNDTVEFMDVSYNDSSIQDKTITDLHIDSANNVADSDGEFVDCEITFTNQSDLLVDEENKCDDNLISGGSVASKLSENMPINNVTQDIGTGDVDSAGPQPSITSATFSKGHVDATISLQSADKLLTAATFTKEHLDVTISLESADKLPMSATFTKESLDATITLGSTDRLITSETFTKDNSEYIGTVSKPDITSFIACTNSNTTQDIDIPFNENSTKQELDATVIIDQTKILATDTFTKEIQDDTILLADAKSMISATFVKDITDDLRPINETVTVHPVEKPIPSDTFTKDIIQHLAENTQHVEDQFIDNCDDVLLDATVIIDSTKKVLTSDTFTNDSTQGNEAPLKANSTNKHLDLTVTINSGEKSVALNKEVCTNIDITKGLLDGTVIVDEVDKSLVSNTFTKNNNSQGIEIQLGAECVQKPQNSKGLLDCTVILDEVNKSLASNTFIKDNSQGIEIQLGAECLQKPQNSKGLLDCSVIVDEVDKNLASNTFTKDNSQGIENQLGSECLQKSQNSKGLLDGTVIVDDMDKSLASNTFANDNSQGIEIQLGSECLQKPKNFTVTIKSADKSMTSASFNETQNIEFHSMDNLVTECLDATVKTECNMKLPVINTSHTNESGDVPIKLSGPSAISTNIFQCEIPLKILNDQNICENMCVSTKSPDSSKIEIKEIISPIDTTDIKSHIHMEINNTFDLDNAVGLEINNQILETVENHVNSNFKETSITLNPDILQSNTCSDTIQKDMTKNLDVDKDGALSNENVNSFQETAMVPDMPADVPLPDEDDVETEVGTESPITNKRDSMVLPDVINILHTSKLDDIINVDKMPIDTIIQAADLINDTFIDKESVISTEKTEEGEEDRRNNVAQNETRGSIQATIEKIEQGQLKDTNATPAEKSTGSLNDQENYEILTRKPTVNDKNLMVPDVSSLLAYNSVDPHISLNIDIAADMINNLNLVGKSNVEENININTNELLKIENITQIDVNNSPCEVSAEKNIPNDIQSLDVANSNGKLKEDDFQHFYETDSHSNVVVQSPEVVQKDISEIDNSLQINESKHIEEPAKYPDDTSITQNDDKKDGNFCEEILNSENNSPYVLISADKEADISLEDDFEKIENPFATKSKISISPPASPKIVSKGYNFNFDDIEDPFATKVKIRMSPPLESPKMLYKSASAKKPNSPKSEMLKNRRKTQSERKKPVSCKKTANATLDTVSTKLNEMAVARLDTRELQEIVINELSNTSSTKLEEHSTEVNDCTVDVNLKDIAIGLNEIDKSELEINIDNTSKLEVVSMVGPYEVTDPVGNKSSTTSSSEQSAYYSVATSSGDSIVTKNVFNLPEIDDMNFNPFATKSKMRQTPPPVVNMSSLDSPVTLHQNDLNGVTTKNIDIDQSSENNRSSVDEKECASTSNTTCSSKATDDKDITVREVHTDDEDTIEGPFLELEEFDNDKKSDLDSEHLDMLQFTDLPTQTNDDNELFIDAEAFEFLLNQNKSNVVVDSGKESLFLKFDPLFAKRISSDGVLAALNKVQTRQSTPKKTPKSPQINVRTVENAVAGPSTSNVPLRQNLTEETAEDMNVVTSKPMMVVTPAVNPVVPPRKSMTPTSSNRRSITFTSPAIAVIDRLLSLSANNSLVGHDTTVTQVSREQNEADLALTQLRELLADKEISVYNLRSESKELRDRLTTLETQMKSLEAQSEERLKKVNELTVKLSEKTKINKSMATVVEEYERTIASLIAETEQDKKRHNEERMILIKERDEQTAHLASMEVSFSDLHSKYEKSKQLILSCKANEDEYKKSISEFEENLVKMQNNYQLLKQHATSKLNHANQELEKMNRAHEAEVLKLNAMIKRKDLHITSLEETLAQKTKANEELTAICDELINKVG